LRRPTIAAKEFDGSCEKVSPAAFYDVHGKRVLIARQ